MSAIVKDARYWAAVRSTVSEASPLTSEQRDKLVRILKGATQ